MSKIAEKRPVVIAHRGASAYLPEHSLASKALAYGMGADYLEQDIVVSRDGELLVLHDVVLDHVSDVAAKFPGRQRDDGHYYCIDFDLREIRTLRFAERVQPGTKELRYSGRFPRAAGSFPIVTLNEEIEFIRGLNHATGRSVGIFLEIKEPAWHREQGIDLPSRVLAELADLSSVLERIPVYLACFNADVLRQIQGTADGAFTIIQLLSSKCVIDADLLPDIATYAQGIGPSIQLIYQGKDRAGEPHLTDLVERAHALQLAVHPYTFRADDLPVGIESFNELLELFIGRLNVDGVISDFTDRVIEFRRRKIALGDS